MHYQMILRHPRRDFPLLRTLDVDQEQLLFPLTVTGCKKMNLTSLAPSHCLKNAATVKLRDRPLKVRQSYTAREAIKSMT